jgi:hypothetical protein
MSATNETHELNSSDKVEGTSVYDRSGNKLGTVSSVSWISARGTSLMRCCHSAGFSEWDRAIIPCPGKS